MPTIADVMAILESIAPARLAVPNDRIGLQVGDPKGQVRRGFVSLDRSRAAAAAACASKADLWVCHHPLIWNPLTKVLAEDHVGSVVTQLIQSRVAFFAAHTNWDAADGGINDSLAAAIGLGHSRPFGEGAPQPVLKLVVFCPSDAAEPLLDALSNAGGGRIGFYSRCAFLTEGRGTFRAEAGAHPAIGAVGQVEDVGETRIETVVPAHLKGAVLDALLKAHPYEEPAYDFYPLASEPVAPLGRVGELETALDVAVFGERVETALQTKAWAWLGSAETIRSVAVVGGSGDDYWREALAAGADALVTGEVRQQVALEAADSGISIWAAGHYATEQPGCAALRGRLAEAVPEVEWELYVPEAGRDGRPI